MRERLAAFRRDRSPRAREARAMAARWAEVGSVPSPISGGGDVSVGTLIALAFPERIAKNRGSGTDAFLLANGRGANLDPALPLAREPFLAVAELAGSATQGRILSAAPITLAEIEAHFAARITARAEIAFDTARLSLRGRDSRRLGAIVLGERPVPILADETSAKSLAEGIVNRGIAGHFDASPTLLRGRSRNFHGQRHRTRGNRY